MKRIEELQKTVMSLKATLGSTTAQFLENFRRVEAMEGMV